MNFNQKTIACLASVILTMSVLTPPYSYFYTDRYKSAKHFAGFRLFNASPKAENDAEVRNTNGISDRIPPREVSIKKNLPLLFCEWLTILFLAVGGLLLAADQRAQDKIWRGIFFIIAGLFFALIGIALI